MTRKLTRCFALLILLLLSYFGAHAQAHIVSFTIPQQIGVELIDETQHSINIPVHSAQAVTALTPTIVTNPIGQTVNPASGVQQNFTSAVPYIVNPGPLQTFYSVNVLPARALGPLCPTDQATIPGFILTSPPAGATYDWELRDNTTTVWGLAPGNVQSTTPDDFTTQALANTTNAPIIYTFRRKISVPAVGTVYDSYTDVTVNPSTAISNNTINQPPPASSTFCASGNPGTITGNPPGGGIGPGTYTYKWQSSVNGGPYNIIGGATGPDLTPGPVNQTTSYQRIVSSGVCTPPTTSNPVTITIQNAVTNNHLDPLAINTFCGASTALTLTGIVPSGGDGTYQYQWQQSPDNVDAHYINASSPTATQQNYDVPALTQTTYFRRLASSGKCATPVASDNFIVITIEPPLSLNQITGSTSFCGSGIPVITGTAVTGGNNIPVYSWYSSTDGGTTFTLIPNATGADYTPATPITVNTQYHRIVTSGSCTIDNISAPLAFTVTPAITVNTIHTPTTTFCISTGAFTITGDPPTGGDGTYTYKWQSSTDGVSYSDILINGTSISYDSPSITTTTWFKRVASSGACINTSESTPIKITVYQAFAGNTITPPTVSQFCGPGNAGPITGLIPTGGDGNPQYQWQQSPDNVNADFTDITGQTGKDFDPPALTSSMFYRRVVTGPVCTAPDISTPVEIHITPPITPNTNQINAPLTTTFCTSVNPATIVGGIAQGGDGPGTINYQWEYSNNNGAQWFPVPANGNNPDYDPDPITLTTSYRRGATSGACVIPNYSATITLNIIPSPPNITIAPVAPVCSGSQAVLSVNSPDPALTYYWYDTRTRDHLLHTGPTFTTDPLTVNQTFYAEASNGTCQSPQMASFTVTVNALPDEPVLDGAPYTGCQGLPTTLAVANPQPGITYNWYAGPAGGSPVGPPGATFVTPALTDNVTYYVEAMNTATGCVSATRGIADITVYPAPIADAQDAAICPGTFAVLTANGADQDQEVSWYANANDTQSLLTGSSQFTTPVLSANATYYVEVRSVVSGCVSARVPVQVRMIVPLNAPIVQIQNAIAPTVTFQWAPITDATGYLVSVDGGPFAPPSSGSNGTTQTVNGVQTGQRITLIVRATGVESCELSDSSAPVTATAINPNTDEIFVANAFTPNGDGKNDIVYVRNENIKSLKFYVYSQYGELLYQSQSQQNGWDGTFKGKTEPAGVYVYYLEAIMNDGTQVNKKGTITLIR